MLKLYLMGSHNLREIYYARSYIRLVMPIPLRILLENEWNSRAQFREILETILYVSLKQF